MQYLPMYSLLRAHLEHVEELKGLHLKAKGAIDQQEDQVSVLGCIDGGRQVLWALDEGQPVGSSQGE